jgi:predicted O-methyltransferase YrrM
MNGVTRHPQSWVPFEQLGKAWMPYLATYSGFGELIDDTHRELAAAPRVGPLIDIGVPGWLRVEDALKLYELAYYCTGNILELGTNRGLSASVLASAVAAAGNGANVVTIDVDPSLSDTARRNLKERRLDHFVQFVAADALLAMNELVAKGMRFGLCFVDHSHSYEAVTQACYRLPQLVSPGGFVVFHDFLDGRNTRRKDVGDSPEEYGVYAAVEEALPRAAFEFYGCYGCCGVFRKQA